MVRRAVVVLAALAVGASALPSPPTFLAPNARSPSPSLRLRGGALVTENQVAQVTSGVYFAGSIAGLVASRKVMKMYGLETSPAEVNAFRMHNFGSLSMGIILLLMASLGKSFRQGVGIASVYWFFWVLYQTFHKRGMCKKFNLPKSSILPWSAFHLGIAFAAFFEHLEDFAPVIYTLFVVGLLNSALTAFNTTKFLELFAINVSQSPASSILWRSQGLVGIGMAIFLMVYVQTKSVGTALVPFLAIQTLNYAYAVAKQEWRAMKMPNGVGVLLYGLVYAGLTYAAFLSTQ